MKADDNENHWPRGPRDFVRLFRQAAEDTFAGMGLRVVRNEDWSYTLAHADGKEQQVGLHNLYLRACRSNRAGWPDMIREFLANLDTSSYDDISEAPLADVASQLLPRVGKAFTGTGDIRPWTQQLGTTDLVINLVIDLPRSMIYVNEGKISDSGKPGEEWLARAVDNLVEKTPASVFRSLDAGVLVCDTNDSYDSARSLVVERVLPASPAGYLVAIPSRDLLAVMPVTLERMADFHKLKLFADRSTKDAPYAVSGDVYWVCNGEWRPFPVAIRGTEITVTPPPGFIEALNALS